MRLFMDSVIALMLTAILAGVVWYRKVDQTNHTMRETARSEVRRFQQQIALQSALAQVERNDRGYPLTVDPDWFKGSLPMNPLLGVNHPWLEVAAPDQKDLLHPPNRIASSSLLAKFWYNPAAGVVRARVPAEVSDAAALELYNFVNESVLTDLFSEGKAATPAP